LAFRKRPNASRTSAGVQGLNALADVLAARERVDFRTILLADLAGFRVSAGAPSRFLARLDIVGLDFSRGFRVIFAMLGVY
jgi:hypothetical protein